MQVDTSPLNRGQKWTNEEENALLHALLFHGTDFAAIAALHQRSVGSIRSRCREIAYKLYCAGADENEIMQRTRLDAEELSDVIRRREKRAQKRANKQQKKAEHASDIAELKQGILRLTEEIKEIHRLLHGMIHGVLEATERRP